MKNLCGVLVAAGCGVGYFYAQQHGYKTTWWAIGCFFGIMAAIFGDD